MNLNNNPDELKKEEQVILDELIGKMNHVIHSLDQRMRNYIDEAKNADISVNPDLYLSQVLAQQGLKDTVENRQKFLQARDELYHTRLLVEYEDVNGKGINEIKVGLHSCQNKEKTYVTSWTMPVCRQYILDSSTTDFVSTVKDKHGDTYLTRYKLLVKNQVTLRFTRVVKAMNLYPSIFDDETLKLIKGTGFLSDKYLDELIDSFDPDEYNPDSAAKIISDEFLQELLERRSTPEFKNIVFSIQKKQGEIIQAPYSKNMIVQGCAGSGKSMIMLHRLPVILYDNPNSLNRSNLYIITPSQMYIQMAENMRHQLEISDINMGTIEQYYDYCIAKYPGHKAGEYGKINYGIKLKPEDEKYLYSPGCVTDIRKYFADLFQDEISLEKAKSILSINENGERAGESYAQQMNRRLLILQKILNANNAVLTTYFKGIRDVANALYTLSATLYNRRDEVFREIAKKVSKEEENIINAQREIDKLDIEQNSIAIENRNNTIAVAKNNIIQLQTDKSVAEADTEYFEGLLKLSEKIESVLEPFSVVKNEISKNSDQDVYEAIDKTGQLIGGFFMLSWEFSKLEDKYDSYVGAISKKIEEIQERVSVLQNTKARYLEFDYYRQIRELRDRLSDANMNAIKNAYVFIMDKIGIKPNDSGNIRAFRGSPYLYLQIMYQYQGVPNAKLESLLSIDEAQGIASEEIRLLKHINADRVVFNMFGDIYQHIEGTKGIDSWNEYKEIIEYDVYEMQENYRNASQITDYCNGKFGMDMIAINTPGKGVHEMKSESEFQAEMLNQLMDTKRTGLAAILVSNDAEARYLMNTFSNYEQKFHDMTDEEFSIHRTRWNIINVDDAKGLEFSSVIVLSGRMSRNEQYIAFTRALDELFVYPLIIDTSGYEKKTRKKEDNSETTQSNEIADLREKAKTKHVVIVNKKNYANSEVRSFFEERGLEVVDKRNEGGRLWVLGEKVAIREFVNAAIAKFGISGKYASSKESKNRNGWCTKTEK